MSVSLLIDQRDGSPSDFYELVRDELRLREIPGLRVEHTAATRSKGLFAGSEKADVLTVFDDSHESQVFAYSFGRTFNVLRNAPHRRTLAEHPITRRFGRRRKQLGQAHVVRKIAHVRRCVAGLCARIVPRALTRGAHPMRVPE